VSLLRILIPASAMLAAGAAAAQSDAPSVPLKDLFNEGYQVASSTSNGNSAEVVLVLSKDKKHFACVLSGLRADTYAQGKAKPVFPPCVPLN
jgi:hypothetical protein